MSRLQNEDHKTLAQITGAGGSASQLLNDTKVYVTANSINKQLSQAIIDGDIGGGGGVTTQPTNLINLGISSSVSSNTLIVDLKQADGTTNPSSGSGSVILGVRSSTATSGGYNLRTVSSAVGIVVPSGATLGTSNGTSQQLWVYAIDNAGTIELAISLSLYQESQLISTTALSASSDSNNVMYSTTARTNVPFRLIGKITSTQTTAGTWATTPSNVATGSYGALTYNIPIAAKYMNSAPTTFTSAFAFDAPTKAYDTHNCVTGAGASAWRFNAPVDGIYLITGSTYVNTPASFYSMIIYKNGSPDTFAGAMYVTNLAPSNIAVPMQLVAGDYIDWRTDAGSGALATTNASNQFVAVNLLR